jgi:hypothetical protein
MYDSINNRLGGFAIFRQRVARGVVFEALVSLSSADDTRYYLPFDNREGFVTSMAIVNPSATAPTTVTATFRTTEGQTLTALTRTLAPRQQIADVIPTIAPQTQGRAGVLEVSGSGTLLSSLGFRFSAGGAFATIPIMNWTGMFPPNRP